MANIAVSKLIGYVTVEPPTGISKLIGYATISTSGFASGPIGNITLGGLAGRADVTATGAMGGIVLSGIPGGAGGFITGPTGNLVLGGLAGRADITEGGPLGNIRLSGVPGVVSVTAIGPIGNIVLGGVAGNNQSVVRHSRITQMGFLATVLSHPDARTTQMGFAVLGKNIVKARITQMGLLVLAKGGDTPLVPDVLNLHDMGREPVLRQRFVNMYPEPTPQGPAADARYQRAGLYSAAQRGGGPIQLIQHWIGPDPTRGGSIPATNQFIISISGGNVFRDNINIGTVDPFIDPTWFPTGRRIHAARSQTQFMAASNGKLYQIDLDSVTQVPVTDVLPAGVRDVAFLAGRFVYILDDDSGQFYWSEIGDGTVIDGLSFATASEDDPLPTLAVWDLSDDLVFFTSETAEFWYASADPDNPYQRSTGRRYNKGLLAIDSVELIDNSLFWLGHDRQIYRTSFIFPQKVSNFDIDDRIRRLKDDEVQQCYAFGVTSGGHNFYVIHLMSQGTWAYDIASKTWAEWKSYNKDRFRGYCSDDTFRILGDYYTGNLMGLDGGIYTDMKDDATQGDPIERICSAYMPLQKGRHINFNAILHCTRGVGLAGDPLAFGANPQVEMRFSNHEGNDFSVWLPSNLGPDGDRGEASKAVWSMLGGVEPPGRLFEFRCTEPVFFAPYKLRVDEERP